MFERYYSFFRYCLVVAWCSKKVFRVNRNGGAQAVIRGARPPWLSVATALDVTKLGQIYVTKLGRFLHTFLASIVWKVVQVYRSLLRESVGNFIAQAYENENQCLESLSEFLREIWIELYFASKFSESRRSQRKKLSF